MSDTRWSDVEADIEEALRHFGMALRIYEAGGFDDPDIEGYKSTSSFKHAMEAGYTAVERAVERILGILGEELPSGRDCHKALLDRVTRPLAGDHARPAIFDEEMKRDMLEALSMRHRVDTARTTSSSRRKPSPRSRPHGKSWVGFARQSRNSRRKSIPNRAATTMAPGAVSAAARPEEFSKHDASTDFAG